MQKSFAPNRAFLPNVRGQKYILFAQSVFPEVQKVNCPVGAREATLGCAPGKND